MVFFDLDDTLMDYTAAMRTAAAVFWADHLDLFADHSIDSFLTLWESLAAKYHRQATAGEIGWHDQQRLRMQELYKLSGRELSPAEATNEFSRFFDVYRRHWRLFADVLPCLNKLKAKNVPLGVISNGESLQQHRKLQVCRVEERFQAIVISSEVGLHKPDPAIFRHACEQAGVKAGDCLYVGDQLDGDARAAVAAGLHGIWLNRAARPAPGCDVETIESLRELPSLVGIGG
ncbi:MAG: HAD family hydrolase [Phycisphaerae bacterium]|nr:HAD family hydrolase [Phycisphaerae bacterium]